MIPYCKNWLWKPTSFFKRRFPIQPNTSVIQKHPTVKHWWGSFRKGPQEPCWWSPALYLMCFIVFINLFSGETLELGAFKRNFTSKLLIMWSHYWPVKDIEVQQIQTQKVGHTLAQRCTLTLLLKWMDPDRHIFVLSTPRKALVSAQTITLQCLLIGRLSRSHL